MSVILSSPARSCIRTTAVVSNGKNHTADRHQVTVGTLIRNNLYALKRPVLETTAGTRSFAIDIWNHSMPLVTLFNGSILVHPYVEAFKTMHRQHCDIFRCGTATEDYP